MRAARFWLVGTALLLAAGCAGLGPAGEFEPPRIGLANIHLVDLGLLEQRYVIDLRVQNPNPVALDVEGMEYRLSVDGEEYAYGVSDRAFGLGPYGETRIAVDIVSGPRQLLQNLRRLQSGLERGLQYEFRGSVYVPALRAELPFTAKGRLGDVTETEPASDYLL